MAEVVLTVHTIDNKTPATGKVTDNETTMASANTYTFANTGVEMIYVYGGAAGATFTVQTPQTADDLAVAESVIALTASKAYLFGPFPSKTYNNASGKVTVTSSVDDTKIFVFKKATN